MHYSLMWNYWHKHTLPVTKKHGQICQSSVIQEAVTADRNVEESVACMLGIASDLSYNESMHSNIHHVPKCGALKVHFESIELWVIASGVFAVQAHRARGHESDNGGRLCAVNWHLHDFP